MSTKRNQECFQIQQWIANWMGTSVDKCPYTFEDVQALCHGPLREVLVEFVLPRFKNDQQIRVIRANLYVNDVASKSSKKNPPARKNKVDKDIEELKQKLVKTKEEKAVLLRRISANKSILDTSRIELHQTLVDKLSFFKNVKSHSKYVKTRIASTAILQKRLQNDECSDLTGRVPSTSTSPNIDLPLLDGASPHLTLLKSLYNDTLDLFNIYFLQDSNSSSASNFKVFNMPAMEAEISSKTNDLRQLGISPYLVEKWARNEQKESSIQLKNASETMTDIMSPIAELTKEADNLYINMMKALVQLYSKNKESKKTEQALETQNSANCHNAVINGECVLPADLMSLLEMEKTFAQLKKYKELILQIETHYSTYQGTDEVLMKLLRCSSECTQNKAGSSKPPEDEQSQELSADACSPTLNDASQETLEDLACALLKSFPQSTRRLETIVNRCRSLVVDELPKTIQACRTAKGVIASKITETKVERKDRSEIQEEDFQIRIPDEFMPTYCLSYPVGNDPKDLDLEELFKLRGELEMKRVQSEVVVKNSLGDDSLE